MDPFVGEIRLFSGNFAPQGWLACNGQQLNVREYQLLYALLGIEFGGTIGQTFNLPDLTGRAPLHRGTGPGLTAHNFGSKGGEATHTLTYSEMPSHNHTLQSLNTVNTPEPNNAMWGNIPKSGIVSAYNTTADTQMNSLTIGVSGMSQPHNNMQPFVGITYIICYEGIYPNLND